LERCVEAANIFIDQGKSKTQPVPERGGTNQVERRLRTKMNKVESGELMPPMAVYPGVDRLLCSAGEQP
jgi:hypothetical protein